MTATIAETAARCVGCGAEKATKPTKDGEPRLPKGWKDTPTGRLCGACLHGKYILRACVIPILRPVGDTWKDFGDALHDQWSLMTAATNYATSLLYAADSPRMPGDAKLVKMPQVYLYPKLREAFPGIAPTTIVSLEQAAKGKYAAKRFDVLWLGKASTPNARYPQPLPLNAQSWSVELDGQGCPVVSASFGGRRWSLQLKTKGMGRQLGMVRQIVDGLARQGEAAIYRSGDDTLCKLVGWFPKRERNETLEGTLLVRTDLDALLYAVNEGREQPWVLNGDRVRNWINGHRRRLMRWSEDQKAETRPAQPMAGKQIKQDRERSCEKYRRRLDTFLHETTAQLANFAKRQRVAEVKYNDSEQGYCPEFPYAALRERLATKLDALGICFVHANASGGVRRKTTGPLAE